MRIFFGGIATETNTFSPIPTGMAAYESCFLKRAGEHPDHAELFTAPLWALKERRRERGAQWDIIQGLCAFAMPGARTTRAAYESMRDEMLDDLKRALPVDMVVLGLHGAMIAEGYDDCEGDLLRRVRDIVGSEVPIGAELDLHCILTDEMVAQSNVLVAFKQYPHTDIMARAFELVDIMLEVAAGKVQPVSSLYDCRMIALMHTTREPMAGIVRRMEEMERMPGVLSVSIAHSFPWGDVPGMGTKVLVVTDNNPILGATLAEELGRMVVAARGNATEPHPALDSALATALAYPEGPIVIADTADNAGAGAGSDSTFLLEALIRRGIGNTVIGPLWDPVSVRFCLEAGVGATIALRIGGKVGPASGQPIDATVRIEAIKRDATMVFAGLPTSMGDAALVAIGVAGQEPIRIVLNTIRTQAYGVELFTQFGLDLSRQRLIIVKSMQHFYAAFAPIAKAVVYMGSPGTASQDFKSLTYKSITRPMWPFDAT